MNEELPPYAHGLTLLRRVAARGQPGPLQGSVRLSALRTYEARGFSYYDGVTEELRDRLHEVLGFPYLNCYYRTHRGFGDEATLAVVADGIRQLEWMDVYPHGRAVHLAMHRYCTGRSYKKKEAAFLAGDIATHLVARRMVMDRYPMDMRPPTEIPPFSYDRWAGP